MHALGILDNAPGTPLHFLGTLGLLFIMFIAGLEMDIDDFNKFRFRSLGYGIISFLLPQAAEPQRH